VGVNTSRKNTYFQVDTGRQINEYNDYNEYKTKFLTHKKYAVPSEGEAMHVILSAFLATRLAILLAGFNILQFLQNALSSAGYPAVLLFVMIESSGIPFPGETMLLLASFYAAVNGSLQIPLVIVFAALGAIIGDNLGYYAGRTGGKAIVERYGRYVFIKPGHLERAEKFFNKHGDKTVFFGRFVAVLRAWAAFLAGVNRMRWRTFFIYNAAGGIVWATIFGCLGFFAGRTLGNFTQLEHLASKITWIITGILLVVVAVILFIYFTRRGQKPSDDT
jgi:membrane protein DedA with SNARE-associated domain